MILQEIYLKKYDWIVRAYFNVDSCYPLIAQDLKDIGCEDTDDILRSLKACGMNCGFTYTEPYYNTSVLVVGISSSIDEFQNTFDHEKGHLAMHIAEIFDIDLYSEEFQYLTGMIGQLLYFGAKKYLCKCDT